LRIPEHHPSKMCGIFAYINHLVPKERKAILSEPPTHPPTHLPARSWSLFVDHDELRLPTINA